MSQLLSVLFVLLLVVAMFLVFRAQRGAGSKDAASPAVSGRKKGALESAARVVDTTKRIIWAAFFGLGGVAVLASGEVLGGLLCLAVSAVFVLPMIQTRLQSRVAAASPPVGPTAVSALGDVDTIACPYCAETIKAAAVVCRWCGRDLPQAPNTQPREQ